MAGHVVRIGEVRDAYKILAGRPEGRRPLGKPRRRWEDNTKIDLREIGFGDVDWIHLAQDRDRWRAVVNTVMKCISICSKLRLLSSLLILLFIGNYLSREENSLKYRGLTLSLYTLQTNP
jgi:hypothetical protein